jgi:transcriptional regulator
MYTPKHNAESDLAVIRALVRDYAFGTLLAPRADGQIEITHVPFLLASSSEGDVLRVHVARANRIWRDVLAANRPGDVIVVFNGPHGYVSPMWYERTQADVPTWNYAVVHAHVTAPVEMSHDELYAGLDDLAKANEPGPTVWRLEEHPAESREQLMKSIVGLVLPVARWDAKVKMSQNRTPADHARVLAAFEARNTEDDRAMARMMREYSA